MTTTIERSHKVNYGDIMIWLGLAIVVLWMIAKIIGFIP
jgi:hypothetical protein